MEPSDVSPGSGSGISRSGGEARLLESVERSRLAAHLDADRLVVGSLDA